MNFPSCEKQIFKSFGCTKILKKSKWTKASRNEVKQSKTSNHDSRPIFPYHIHNQADFDNSFFNGKRLYLLGHFEDEFYFLGTSKLLGAALIKGRS